MLVGIMGFGPRRMGVEQWQYCLMEACSLGSLGSHALSPPTSAPLFNLPSVAFALEGGARGLSWGYP